MHYRSLELIVCLSVLTDINECEHPDACGKEALCTNTPGNYTCACPKGFQGNPYEQVKSI